MQVVYVIVRAPYIGCIIWGHPKRRPLGKGYIRNFTTVIMQSGI